MENTKTYKLFRLQIVRNKRQHTGQPAARAIHSTFQRLIAVDPMHGAQQNHAQATSRHHTQVSRSSATSKTPAELQLAHGRHRRHLPQRSLQAVQNQPLPIRRGPKDSERSHRAPLVQLQLRPVQENHLRNAVKLLDTHHRHSLKGHDLAAHGPSRQTRERLD